MPKKKKSKAQEKMKCPYCGRIAVLRDAAYVYGKNNIDPDGRLYVCGGYPECDAYVGAHKGSGAPKGTLADSGLRHKRIVAHRALDRIWKQGIMTKAGTYIWLQNRLNLRRQDMHIGGFSEYYCGEVIRECTKLLADYEVPREGGVKDTWQEEIKPA